MRRFVAVLALLACNVAHAVIPGELNPLVVAAPFSFFVREFDLTKAFEKSKAENKPMFIYLDAWDCPPCKECAEFLGKNIERLKLSVDRILPLHGRIASVAELYTAARATMPK